MDVQTIGEIAKVFGGISVAGVCGIWIYSLLKTVERLEERIASKDDHIQESERRTTELSTELKILVATLIKNQDNLPSVIQTMLGPLESSLNEIKAEIRNRSRKES